MLLLNLFVLVLSIFFLGKKYLGLQLINLFAAILFSGRVLLDSGYSEYLNGYLNVFFLLPYFLLARRIKFNEKIAFVIIFSLPLVPFLLGLSTYYYNYLLGIMLVCFAVMHRRRQSRSTRAGMLIVLMLLALGLQKYSFIFLAIAVVVLGIRASNLYYYALIGVVFILAFNVSIHFSDYGTLDEFIDRRVTRDSYEAARGETFMGISDGGRFLLWRIQFAKLGDDFLIGKGLNWDMFLSEVPNHNIVVSWLLTYGVIGLLLLVAYVFFVFKKVRDPFFIYPVVSLLLLSMVSEGILLDYLTPAFAIQCGMFSMINDRIASVEGLRNV